MDKTDETVRALRGLSVETGSLACLGCGHEHNCGTQGCAILRDTDGLIKSLKAQLAESQRREQKAVEDLSRNWMCESCLRRVVGHEWCGCEDRHFIKLDSGVITCAAFKWSGQQEAGKGGTE